MEFKATLDSLSQIMEHIRERAQADGLAPSLVNKIELACEEAVVNIITHAYENRGGHVSVLCEKKGGRFEITLRDRGLPFNPIDAEINPQFNTPVQERKIGGMGIFLMRKIIDEVSYQREGRENILRLVFTLL